MLLIIADTPSEEGSRDFIGGAIDLLLLRSSCGLLRAMFLKWPFTMHPIIISQLRLTIDETRKFPLHANVIGKHQHTVEF